MSAGPISLLWWLIILVVVIVVIILLLKLVFAIIAIGPFAIHNDDYNIPSLVAATRTLIS